MQSWNPMSHCLADGHQLVLQHFQEWETQHLLIDDRCFSDCSKCWNTLSVPEPKCTFPKLLVLCSSTVPLHYKVFLYLGSPHILCASHHYPHFLQLYFQIQHYSSTQVGGEQIFMLLRPKCGTNIWPTCGERTTIVCRICSGFFLVWYIIDIFHQPIKTLTFKVLLGNQKSATFP